jgi:hypothetical protein
MNDEYLAELCELLQAEGMTTARVENTGGGVMVLFVDLDETARSGDRYLGVTWEEGWLVCLYDQDEHFDGLCFQPLTDSGISENPVGQIGHWLHGFAKLTETILP